jgi:hypothetical protein
MSRRPTARSVFRSVRVDDPTELPPTKPTVLMNKLAMQENLAVAYRAAYCRPLPIDDTPTVTDRTAVPPARGNWTLPPDHIDLSANRAAAAVLVSRPPLSARGNSQDNAPTAETTASVTPGTPTLPASLDVSGPPISFAAFLASPSAVPMTTPKSTMGSTMSAFWGDPGMQHTAVSPTRVGLFTVHTPQNIDFQRLSVLCSGLFVTLAQFCSFFPVICHLQ